MRAVGSGVAGTDNGKKVSGSGGKLITQVRLWLMLLQYRKRHLVRLIINLIHNAEWRLLLYSLHEACDNETAAAAGVSAKETKQLFTYNYYWLNIIH